MQNDDLKSTNDRMMKQRGQTFWKNYYHQCTGSLVQQIPRRRLQTSNLNNDCSMCRIEL